MKSRSYAWVFFVVIFVGVLGLACSVDRGKGPDAGIVFQKEQFPRIDDLAMTIGGGGLPDRRTGIALRLQV